MSDLEDDFRAYVIQCLNLIMQKLDDLSLAQTRQSAAISSLQQQSIRNDDISIPRMIKYPSPMNTKEKNKKIIAFLRQIGANDEQVERFRKRFLVETRNVCEALKSRKPATRSLAYSQLDEEDKVQMVNLATAALISYDGMLAEINFTARYWPVYFVVQSCWTNSSTYKKSK